MAVLMLFLGILLYSREKNRPAPIQTNDEESFWKKILNNHSDFVLVVKQNEEIHYLNRQGKENATTLKEAMEPYAKLESLRFKEENLEIKHWVLAGNCKDESSSHISLLKGGFNEISQGKMDGSTKTPLNKMKDSLNSRRSFYLIEDHSPPSALRRKKLKDSLKVHTSLQGLIELFLGDMERLERITSEKNAVFVGKIWHLPEAGNNFGEADRDHSEYEIKFSVSRLKQELALVIVITETTNYHMVSKLEEVTKYKNSILGSFSHVLRTPLNGIVNFLAVAKDNTEIPVSAIANLISPAITCSQQLMYMINDVLDYSQLSLKSFTLNFSPQEIKPALEEILHLFEAEARLKRITLKYDISEFTPPFIRTDFTRLKQILINLLKYSLSQTFSGEILLSVHYQCGNQLLFTLTDVGVELDDEAKKLLELVLLQNETSEVELTKILNKPLGGNIGLVISSRLARLLGPKETPVGITYNSTPDRKLEFSFIIEDRPDGVDFMDVQLISHVETGNHDYLRGLILSRMKPNSLEHALPFPHCQSENFDFEDGDREALAEQVLARSPKNSYLKSKPSTIITTQPTKTRPSFNHSKPKLLLRKNSLNQSKFAQPHSIPRVLSFCSCKNVLIVDDDAFNILSLGELLKSLGVPHEEAFNGDEALELINKKKRCCDSCRLYSMIFMDCNMPVRDGYETTKILKKKMIEGEIAFIPIVACTAYVVDFQSSKCAEVGMDDYICKPVNKTILLNILKRWEVL